MRTLLWTGFYSIIFYPANFTKKTAFLFLSSVINWMLKLFFTSLMLVFDFIVNNKFKSLIIHQPMKSFAVISANKASTLDSASVVLNEKLDLSIRTISPNLIISKSNSRLISLKKVKEQLRLLRIAIQSWGNQKKLFILNLKVYSKAQLDHRSPA